jgi:hypothetical protein
MERVLLWKVMELYPSASLESRSGKACCSSSTLLQDLWFEPSSRLRPLSRRARLRLESAITRRSGNPENPSWRGGFVRNSAVAGADPLYSAVYGGQKGYGGVSRASPPQGTCVCNAEGVPPHTASFCLDSVCAIIVPILLRSSHRQRRDLGHGNQTNYSKHAIRSYAHPRVVPDEPTSAGRDA